LKCSLVKSRIAVREQPRNLSHMVSEIYIKTIILTTAKGFAAYTNKEVYYGSTTQRHSDER